MKSSQLAHRIVLAVEINAYSRRSTLGQIEAQRFLVEVLATAAREADMDRSRWVVQPRGDGELAVLPRGIDSVAVVGVFIDRLANEINRYNRNASIGGRLRVRLAVHLGSLAISENGLAGHAPVEVSRLLDAAPLKELLAGNPGQDLAVIVSSAFYKNMVRTGLPPFQPGAFEAVRVEAKGVALDAHVLIGDQPGRASRSGRLLAGPDIAIDPPSFGAFERRRE